MKAGLTYAMRWRVASREVVASEDCGSRSGLRGEVRVLPNQWNPVGREFAVGGDDGEISDFGLRDDDAVEWVFVTGRKLGAAKEGLGGELWKQATDWNGTWKSPLWSAAR